MDPGFLFPFDQPNFSAPLGSSGGLDEWERLMGQLQGGKASEWGAVRCIAWLGRTGS